MAFLVDFRIAVRQYFRRQAVIINRSGGTPSRVLPEAIPGGEASDMPEASPAFQLYARDFYTGTADLSPAEIGTYIRGLCWSWDNGPVPLLFERRSRVFLNTPDEHAAIWPAIEHLWKATPEGYINERLEAVRKDRTQFLAAKSSAGRRSGEVRRQKSEHKSNKLEHLFKHTSEHTTNGRPNITLNEIEPSISISSTDQEQDQNLPAVAGPSFQQPVENFVETFEGGASGHHPGMGPALPDRPSQPAAGHGRQRMGGSHQAADRDPGIQPLPDGGRHHAGHEGHRGDVPPRPATADLNPTPAEAARVLCTALLAPSTPVPYDAFCQRAMAVIDGMGLPAADRDALVRMTWKIDTLYPEFFTKGKDTARTIWRIQHD